MLEFVLQWKVLRQLRWKLPLSNAARESTQASARRTRSTASRTGRAPVSLCIEVRENLLCPCLLRVHLHRRSELLGERISLLRGQMPVVSRSGDRAVVDGQVPARMVVAANRAGRAGAQAYAQASATRREHEWAVVRHYMATMLRLYSVVDAADRGAKQRTRSRLT